MSVTLTSGDLEATFVPEAGMVGCSLTHRGEELLGQRGGLEAYVAERKTMGIPLLYPWANRLSSTRFTWPGARSTSTPSGRRCGSTANGLPMHGLLSAAPGWRVERQDEATLAARFDFAAHPDLWRPSRSHTVLFDVRSRGDAAITTTVAASGDRRVPIAFGFHPYFALPGVARADWQVEVPVTEQLRLDHLMLPTGETRHVRRR